MSRPTGKSLKQDRLDRMLPAERVPYATYLVRKILSWSRLIRIVIITVLSMGVTAAIFPLVDAIYIRGFFDENTRILPSFITAGIGIIIYGLGWWLLVGIRGEKRPERIGILIYVLVGILAILLVFILIITGYSTAILPVA